MTIIVFDVAAFRAIFAPVFDSTALYSNAKLQGYFDLATGYISAEDNACYVLSGLNRVQALNYLTAHLAKLFDMIAAGETPGLAQSATIDKISVSMTPPPNQSQFEYWLNLTGYGQMLLQLLQVLAVGGFYVGGLPERGGFRRIGGGFGY